MKNNPKKISVIGLGVVGLTTAVGFSQKGNQVVGIDINAEKVKTINQGQCPTYEEGLAKALKETPIHATTDFEACLDSDISFLCGGTPGCPDGSLDLRFVKRPAEQLAEVLTQKKNPHLVVMRSTVLPGTTEGSIAPVFNGLDGVSVCVNPEFLREGTALYDFLNPSRIVIGANETETAESMADLYSNFNGEILRTNIKTAEMIKYASNIFLATKVSFINEIGNLCKLLGIDVYDVAKGMGQDERIGNQYLRAGIGFGGFCLPKDLAALTAQAKQIGYEPRILEDVALVNKQQPMRMLKLLKKHVPVLHDKNIGLLGLAFKPGTDDVRSSVAHSIVEALLAEGARVCVYDPVAMENYKAAYPGECLDYTTADKVLAADATIIVTEWPEFELLDYTHSIVIDGRRIEKARYAKIYEGICW